MGGNAFDQTQNLRVPRMPQNVYIQMRDYILATLLKYYNDAKTPIEAPGKVDHGDVDVLVHGPIQPELDPHQTDKQAVANRLSNIFSARAVIVGKGEQPIHLAIPYPAHFRDKNDPNECFIQIDLHICKDLNAFRWEYFHAAHGDLWSILGSIIKPWGLTINGKGLSVRVPEIEAVSPKSSLVFLSDDPKDILEFLGMDHDKWWKPFSTQNELYEYAATCRIFHAGEKIPTCGDPIYNDNVPDHEVQEDSSSQNFNTNDRKRFKTRPLFREWFVTFIPILRLQDRYCSPLSLTRETIREEAITTFKIKDSYQKTLGDWLLKKNQQDVVRVIKESIPAGITHQDRAAIVREMKEVFLNGAESLGTVPAESKKDDGGLQDLEGVGRFVWENWKVARDLGLAKEREKSRRLLEDRDAALAAKKEIVKE